MYSYPWIPPLSNLERSLTCFCYLSIIFSLTFLLPGSRQFLILIQPVFLFHYFLSPSVLPSTTYIREQNSVYEKSSRIFTQRAGIGNSLDAEGSPLFDLTLQQHQPQGTKTKVSYLQVSKGDIYSYRG